MVEHQERRISRIAELASTNLIVALTMISIEAGLLAFTFSSLVPREIIQKGEDIVPFALYEGGPIIWINSNVVMILHNILIFLMILIMTLSIFSFTFSFLYSHDTIEMHAKARLRGGQTVREDAEAIEKFYRKGLLGLKLGVSLLLGFILAVLFEIVATFFVFYSFPLILVTLYAVLYVCFLILIWLKSVGRRRGYNE